MNKLTAYRLKSDNWANAVSLSSSAACWNRTDALSPTVITVPTPRFIVQVRNASLNSARASNSARRPAPVVDEVPRSEEPAAAAEHTAEELADDPTPGPDAATAAPAEAPQVETPPEEKPPEQANDRIELIIDSLPHRRLIKSIPVSVETFANKIFMVRVSELDMTATGPSIGETLVLLKDQIEDLYAELAQKTTLSDAQRALQNVLDEYIVQEPQKAADEPKKSDWFRRF